MLIELAGTGLCGTNCHVSPFLVWGIVGLLIAVGIAFAIYGMRHPNG